MKKILFLFLLSLVAQAQSGGFSPNTDGSKTHYRTYGSGQPLLIINGGPGMNSNGFEALAQKLSKHNLVIIYDQRGTGKSVLQKLDSKTVSMQLMASDIESLRKHLKLEKWHVLGHSFGGMLASYYATLYPERIDKLILSASGGIDLGLTQYVGAAIQSKLTKTERDSLAYWNAKIAKGDTTHQTRLGRGRNLAPAYLYDKKYVPILAERLTQGNADLNQLIWDDLDRIHFDCAPKLKNYKKPVLIIQGKDDIIKAETAEIAHRAFQNSEVVFLEHCGHYGWLDAEKEYFKALHSFLQS
ncbi:alpha/beta fold hydrolase [Flavobacterium sp.]|uniref:alpha/beta fold hydrolase n=1 Tax=Flavobacterium sp. TaxID=239 RepID=UPI0039E51A4B